MSVVVLGGYAVFVVNNPLFMPPQPAYIVFNGQGIEAGGQSNLWHPSLKNKKLKKPKDRAELVMKPDLKENPLMILDGISAGEAETFLNQGGATIAAVTKKAAIKQASGGAGGGTMTAAAGRSGSKGGSGSAQVGAMSSSTVSLSTTPGIRTGAPDATEGTNDGGGDPGGDPGGHPIPVGDGVWILLIMSAGYILYCKKNIR